MHRSAQLLLLIASSLASPFHLREHPLDGKIVGGIPVTIEDYPYQLSLSYRGRHFCGATIISSTTALTAAHCVYGASIEHTSVRAGSSYWNEGGQIVAVKSIRQHPDFSIDKADCDVAVLHLAEPVTEGKPILLAQPGNEILAGTTATVSGWGVLNEGGTVLSNQLQAVNVSIVTDDACEKAYEDFPFNVTSGMLCAGVPEGGKDACGGDSGGPLIVGDKQVGIVSWGKGCARPEYPGVYTKISSVYNWIKEVSGIF